MTNLFRITVLFGLIGVFTLISGCAMKRKQSRVSTLEAQVNQITEEIVRLDQSIQELRATSAAGQTPAESYGAPTGASAIYRTPSGFELPSKSIQEALKNAGYYQGTLDGKIGPGTKQAIKSFQRDNGLEADGVVGRRTWDRLKTYAGSGA